MLEELQKDPWPVPADQRAARCTSTALSIAASLLGACFPGSGARIMAFVGGPSTEGPGAVRIVWFSLFCYLYYVGRFLPDCRECYISGLYGKCYHHSHAMPVVDFCPIIKCLLLFRLRSGKSFKVILDSCRVD